MPTGSYAFSNRQKTWLAESKQTQLRDILTAGRAHTSRLCHHTSTSSQKNEISRLESSQRNSGSERAREKGGAEANDLVALPFPSA